MSKVKIIKIGGNIVDKPLKLEAFLKDFSRIGGRKILVHGGGAVATEMSSKLGIEVKMIDGRRVTGSETIKLVTMVYAGLINKNIVAQLQSYGCNAMGLSGADADVLKTSKRQGKIDWGYVGDVSSGSVNVETLSAFLDLDLIPVFSAITHDGQGQLLNTNADTIASSLAIALSGKFETELIYCFEKDGVLADRNDDSSVIAEIDTAEYKKLQEEGVIADGMIPKLSNAFAAIGAGVSKVIIKHADNILNEKGTVLHR